MSLCEFSAEVMKSLCPLISESPQLPEDIKYLLEGRERGDELDLGLQKSN